jgi:hypothetical protein
VSLDLFNDVGPAFGRREILGLFNRPYFASSRVIAAPPWRRAIQRIIYPMDG